MAKDTGIQEPLNKLSTTLTPLPDQLQNGLIIVSIFGFLSFFACATLFLLLTWRIFKWTKSSRPPNQFVILIYNLVLADMQQSVAFIISSHWLQEEGIFVGTSACWAQGWFVNVGDLASGAFCFFIGLHTFLSVVFDTKLSNLNFGLAIAFIWLMAYSLTIIGVSLHPSDIFVRAVSWCWMNSKYGDLRLWLHYFWIFTFEFGTVLIYIAMFVALRYRIRSNFYSSRGGAQQDAQARTAARLMIIYPIIYVICTLPLATLRMISMASATMPSFAWFCFAGAMITSNGWLDVFLYSMTRRIMLFSDEPPPDNGIETFSMPFSGQAGKRFGNNTICEYTGESLDRKSRASSIIPKRWTNRHHDIELGKSSGAVSMNNSTSQLFFHSAHSPSLSQSSPKLQNDLGFAVKTSTTVEVKSEPLTELEDVKEVRTMKDQSTATAPSHSHGRSTSDRSDIDDIEFATKPEGWP